MNTRSTPIPFVKSIFALTAVTFALGSATAQKLTVNSADYPTLGNPTSAVETPDGRYVFVSVTNVGGPNFTGPDSIGARKGIVSGVQIFRDADGTLSSAGFIRLGSSGANGLALLPGGKTLVVGAGDDGVAFLDVQDAIRGTAKPVFAAQGAGAGTFDVVATPDGRYVFSANEYGVVAQQRGNVGVIAVEPDATGRVTQPVTLEQIPLGDVVPSLTLSRDGTRLYVASELVPAKSALQIAGVANPTLSKNDCVQAKGSPARPNGLITVIDVLRAETSEYAGQDAVLSRTAAGCSPVRLIEASDASAIFVSARGDNAVLQFNPALLESDPDHAFLRSIPAGGDAAVGLLLFDHDRLLAVANSNRFANSAGSLALLSVAKPAEPSLLQTLPTGTFPRNLSLAPDGRSFYLTNYTSRSLERVVVASAPITVASRN
jgi:sugar lactone lactonase YvrE